MTAASRRSWIWWWESWPYLLWFGQLCLAQIAHFLLSIFLFNLTPLSLSLSLRYALLSPSPSSGTDIRNPKTRDKRNRKENLRISPPPPRPLITAIRAPIRIHRRRIPGLRVLLPRREGCASASFAAARRSYRAALAGFRFGFLC